MFYSATHFNGSFLFSAFLAGFSHKNQASNIDLNVVRLCFQVFLEGSEKDKFNVPLTPVVSEPIYDKSEFFSRSWLMQKLAVKLHSGVVIFYIHFYIKITESTWARRLPSKSSRLTI